MKYYIIRTPIGPCVTESDSYRIQALDNDRPVDLEGVEVGGEA